METTTEFLVIDTEGKPEFREIAVINSTGKLVYEAFNRDLPEVELFTTKSKPLAAIIAHLVDLFQGKTLVFHSAEHDLKVLKQSFKKVGQLWPDVRTQCTCKLAKQYFPDFDSHSLESLSIRLDLKVESNRFNPQFAHSARYSTLLIGMVQ